MAEVVGEASNVGLVIIGSAVKGATSGLVTKYLDKVVNPFLRGVTGAKAQRDIKRNLQRYIKSVESRTRVLPSIAIPSGVFHLESVYEPLTVRGESEAISFEIAAYPRELFGHSRCVALTDDAGMGKSTLAKFIVRSAINENRNIPLLVELRRLRPGVSILDAMCTDLAGSDAASGVGCELIRLFESGNFIFVFDGYDEIEDEIRRSVTEEINLLAARFQFCYFLLTSRKEYGTSLFPEFAHFEICKLSREQAHSLIRRYDQERGRAKALVGKIEEANVEEFLGNPLLVTLLYRAFDYRPSIPPKRSIFFRQVFEALFQDHDLSKESFERRKQSGLDMDDFHRVLRALGFITFKSGRVSYSTEEFCEHLRAAVERTALTVDWQKLKLDVVRAVPFFGKDGVDYKWAHKSFQEYFAAQYVLIDLASRRDDAIVKMFESDDIPRYREILRFLAESDLPLVRDVCIEPLLSAIHKSGMSDEEFAEAAIWSTADVFYVGTHRSAEGEVANYRSSLQRTVHEELGIDTGGRVFRSVFNRAEGYGFLVALKPDGFRFALLPVLDPELFRVGRRQSDVGYYNYWRDLFGEAVLRMNDAVLPGRIGQALAAVAQLPLITNDVYERVLESKRRRRGAVAACALEDF